MEHVLDILPRLIRDPSFHIKPSAFGRVRYVRYLYRDGAAVLCKPHFAEGTEVVRNRSLLDAT